MKIARVLLSLIVIAGALSGAAAADTSFAYKTKIAGAKNGLAALLNTVSQLKNLQNRPPVSEYALRRRADRDLKILAEAADSLGYWSARFSYAIDAKAKPARVTVKVDPGPLYRVASLKILGPDGTSLVVPRKAGAPALPLKLGDAARTQPVVATENALIAVLKAHGHPFAKLDHRRVVIDKSAHTMAVIYTFAPGPAMRFGPVSVEGLTHLHPGYVERRLRWRRNTLYDARQVAATRQVLIESGLFSTVSISPKPIPGAPGQVRMIIDAKERLHRTIGVGAAYNTSEGAGARIFWEDRDLFGNAENLKFEGGIGQQKNYLNGAFRLPDFLATDQDLLATAGIADETPTAYHSRRAASTFGLERHFSPQLVGGAGLSVEKANVVELAELPDATASQRSQHYALIGLPAYLRLDTTDSLLNPTRGYRATFSITPYRSFSGPTLSFVTSRLSASHYWQLDGKGLIFAARAQLASIEGASLAHIPADKRIYAGGGGSIRAYGYQLAGPLDSNHKPIGGRSSAEISLELRIRITDTIGLVPFIDAGSYYEKSLPELGHRVLYGPGLGLRYFSPIGPIRLDVATPLVRRPGDSPIQVYISLGQAF